MLQLVSSKGLHRGIHVGELIDNKRMNSIEHRLAIGWDRLHVLLYVVLGPIYLYDIFRFTLFWPRCFVEEETFCLGRSTDFLQFAIPRH